MVGCEQGCDRVEGDESATGARFQSRVFQRRLDELVPIPVPGTEGASQARYSRDGETIVFRAQGEVRAVPRSGGSVVTLYDRLNFGVTIDDDGTAVVAGLPGEGLMTLAGPGAIPEPLTVADSDEFHMEPRILPGGVGVLSNESGRSEVYVRPFPDIASGRILVSTGGGSFPVWSADGGELFYSGPDGMTVVSVETQPTFVPGAPRVLFDASSFATASLGVPLFDVSADGQRFLMLRPESDGDDRREEIVVVQNWLQELGRLVPVR